MSKSFKRNNKYSNYEEVYDDECADHRKHLREKRLRSALRSKNVDRLLELDEDY